MSHPSISFLLSYAIPSITRWQVGYTVDRSAGYLRANTERHTTILSNISTMYVTCERKLEHPEKRHTKMFQWAFKLRTKSYNECNILKSKGEGLCCKFKNVGLNHVLLNPVYWIFYKNVLIDMMYIIYVAWKLPKKLRAVTEGEKPTKQLYCWKPGYQPVANFVSILF